MSTRFIILCLLGLWFIPTSISSEEVRETARKWDFQGDGDRSQSPNPSLTKDESNVYLYWEKSLENISITISDIAGRTVYTETVTIPAGVEHSISIEALSEGDYYISVVQGSNYILGIFTK